LKINFTCTGAVLVDFEAFVAIASIRSGQIGASGGARRFRALVDIGAVGPGGTESLRAQTAERSGTVEAGASRGAAVQSDHRVALVEALVHVVTR